MIEKHRAAVCKDPNSKHPSMSLNAFTPAQLIVMEMMGMTKVENEDFKVEHDAQQKTRSEWEVCFKRQEGRQVFYPRDMSVAKIRDGCRFGRVVRRRRDAQSDHAGRSVR